MRPRARSLALARPSVNVFLSSPGEVGTGPWLVPEIAEYAADLFGRPGAAAAAAAAAAAVDRPTPGGKTPGEKARGAGGGREPESQNAALVHVAVAGAAFAGKSTLLRALTGRSAETRPKPTISVGGGRLKLTEVAAKAAGYGAAPRRLEELERLAAAAGAWHVLAVLDARRGLQAGDREFLRCVGERAWPVTIVLNKADLLPTPQLNFAAAALAESFRSFDRLVVSPRFHTVSAATGAGVPFLRCALAAHAWFMEQRPNQLETDQER